MMRMYKRCLKFGIEREMIMMIKNFLKMIHLDLKSSWPVYNLVSGVRDPLNTSLVDTSYCRPVSVN